jgi:hypothetical protein
MSGHLPNTRSGLRMATMRMATMRMATTANNPAATTHKCLDNDMQVADFLIDVSTVQCISTLFLQRFVCGNSTGQEDVVATIVSFPDYLLKPLTQTFADAGHIHHLLTALPDDKHHVVTRYFTSDTLRLGLTDSSSADLCGLQALTRRLPSFQHLRRVLLNGAGNDLAGAAAPAMQSSAAVLWPLFHQLTALVCLTQLRLTNFQLPPAGEASPPPSLPACTAISHPSSVFRGMPWLSCLQLYHCHTIPPSPDPLAPILPCSTPTDASGDTPGTLSAFLPNLSGLSTFDATSSAFTASPGFSLSGYLSRLHTLTSLTLRDTKISLDDVPKVAAALSHLTRLQALDLSGSPLTATPPLPSSLAVLTTLTSLDLSDSGFAGSCAFAIIDAAQALSRTLRVLVLDGTRPTPKALRGLTALTTLSDLSLRRCALVDSVIEELSEVLDAVPTLRNIRLGGNMFSDAGIGTLLRCI